MAQRPVGISIIAVLAALVGVLAFVGAVLLAALSTAGSFLTDIIESSGAGVMPFDIGGLLSAFLLAFAGIAAIVGILYLIAAYGLWTGKGWARMLAIVLLILDIIGGIVTLPAGIITIIIGGVLLWYFFTPAVKAFFGSAPQAPPPPPPPQ
jgi:uncharacterized membrane protein (DUF2068 family)